MLLPMIALMETPKPQTLLGVHFDLLHVPRGSTWRGRFTDETSDERLVYRGGVDVAHVPLQCSHWPVG